MARSSPGQSPAAAPPDDRPLVTIGLPVYNGAAFLDDALTRLRAQTYPSIEIVVSDNASTDETESIYRAHAADDPRIRYERSPTNQGLVPNFRRALDMARGTYFMYAAYDDLFDPTYVERCLEALQRDAGLSYAVPPSVLIDAAGNRIGIERIQQRVAHPDPVVRFWDTLIVQGGISFYGLARTDTWRAVGRYPTVPRGERVVLAALALWGRMEILPSDLYFRRIHPAQTTVIRRDRRAEVRLVDPTRHGLRATTPVVIAEYVLAYLAAVLRAPLSASERVRAIRAMVRFGFAHLPGLRISDPRAHEVIIDDRGPGVLPEGREGIGY